MASVLWMMTFAVVATTTTASLSTAATTTFALSIADANLGGCGWNRCVNCSGGAGGAVVPCGPQHQICIGKPSPPSYTFHLADPSCDINDPNGPFYDPVPVSYTHLTLPTILLV